MQHFLVDATSQNRHFTILNCAYLLRLNLGLQTNLTAKFKKTQMKHAQ